jgi:hypothetical protein
MFLQPFLLPQSFPRHLACALEGNLSTGNKCFLIPCYLPQDHVEHVETCIALSTLPTAYPRPLIILRGDFQGDLTSKPDKSCHLGTLPYSRLQGLQLPTYAPTQHPEQATYIDHFLVHDLLHTTAQTRDTENIPHVFLDHIGVKATLHIPLTRSYSLKFIDTIPHENQARSTHFQFPIPQPLLTQWKEEVRGATEHTASLRLTDLTYLPSSLNTPTDSITPSKTTTSDNMKTKILESANSIQDHL